MRGYFGTELQQRLQRRADELAATVDGIPGLCNAGRMVSTDDVDRVGLEACVGMLEADGGFGFRLVHEGCTGAITEFLGARGYRVDWWDTFMGSASEVLTLSKQIVERGTPPGFSHVDLSNRPREAELERVQVFLSANGLAPFSRSTLAGESVTGRTFALVDEQGELAATSFVYMPHNSFSEFRTFAWGGLAAVSSAYRGKSLGSYMNACAAVMAFEQYGATVFYEQVAATNAASRRMAEACGLTLHPYLKSGLAITGQEKFTR